MKKNIIKLFSLAVLALAGWSCETQYYNEEYLDGYSPDTEITDVQQIELTLAEADYATIAKNSTNKATAEAAGAEAVSALEAIGKNKYFANEDEVKMYLPAFIAANYPTLDNSSVAFVTYKMALDVPAEIAAMNAPKTYTVSEDDYKGVWDEMAYVKAFTPATIDQLKSVVKTDELEAGDYVAVTYNYATEEPNFTATASVAPAMAAPSFPGAGKYLIIAERDGQFYTLMPLAADKTYGYPKSSTEIVVENGSVVANDASNALVWSFEAGSTSGEYALKGADNRYYSNTGTYKSFNVYDAIQSEGCYYTVTGQEDGTFFVKSTTTNKVLQFGEGTYTTYGLYDGQQGTYPHLYKLNDAGTAYELVKAVTGGGDDPIDPNKPMKKVYQKVAAFEGAGNYLLMAMKGDGKTFTAAKPVPTGKTFGYLETLTIDQADSYDATDELDAVAWTIEAAENAGEFYLKGEGRYHYMSGTYNSFNVKDAVGTDGYTWTIAADADGAFKITNVTMQKWIQLDASYGTYGAYNSEKGAMPLLYKEKMVEITAIVPAIESVKAYAWFQWDGTELKAVENTNILQFADYDAMGDGENCSITAPKEQEKLPAYLRMKYPYATTGDVQFVTYQRTASGNTSWKTDEYTFNGSNWDATIYFADKTGQFRKEEGEWKPDRTLELVYTTMGTPEFKAFCQYCCNWVYDNIDVPLGAPARDNAGVIISADKVTVNGESPAGSWYVSNYGNNEWYAGTYAYYGEMNWSASKARPTYEALGMTGLTDDEIVAKMQQNAAEVFANVLSYMYPEVTYEIHNQIVVKVYDYISKTNYAYTFATIGKGQFEYVEGSFTAL